MTQTLYADNPLGTVGTAASFAATGPVVLEGGFVIPVYFNYTAATSLVLSAGDIIELCKVPKGARILDWYVWSPPLDSATSLTVDVGLLTAGDNCFVDAGSTPWRAGGIADPHNGSLSGLVTTALPYTELTADDVFAITVEASAAGGAITGGVLKGYVRFQLQGETVF